MKRIDFEEFQDMWNESCDCWEGDRGQEEKFQEISQKWENQGLTGWEMAKVLFEIMKERGYAK